MGSRRAGRAPGTGTHVALLRGINLGGRNRLPMARLVDIVESAGCERVRTKFTSTYLDRILGTTTTIRNWRTTRALLDLVRT